MKTNDDDNGKKKKGIAFKTSFEKKTKYDESSSDEDGIVVVTRRKFKILLKRDKQFKRRFHKKAFNKDEEKDDPIICYECKKSRHIKPECPNLKNKKKSKRRAMMAAWEESDYNSSDSKASNSEVTNLCFIGIEDDKVTENSLSYEELLDVVEELHEDFQKIISKNSALQKIKYFVCQ
ncbi:hypothetical protein ACSBR1_031052 [Camellia fascicularis]